MDAKMKDELVKYVAEGCEDVFQQVGHDLLGSSGEKMLTALEMVEDVIGIAAFESYAEPDAKAALDLLLEEYDYHQVKNDVAEACQYENYGY